MRECIVCNQVITNPVCVDCMEKEVEVWLFESKPDLINELKDKTFEINLNSGETDCVLCGNQMCICTYCYSEHLLSWLKKYPELASKFRKIFDFKKSTLRNPYREFNNYGSRHTFLEPKTLLVSF